MSDDEEIDLNAIVERATHFTAEDLDDMDERTSNLMAHMRQRLAETQDPRLSGALQAADAQLATYRELAAQMREAGAEELHELGSGAVERLLGMDER